MKLYQMLVEKIQERWQKILAHPGNFEVAPLPSLPPGPPGALIKGLLGQGSLLSAVLAPGLLAQQGLGAAQTQAAQMNLLAQQLGSGGLGQGPFGALLGARAARFAWEVETPCPRCYQPMYHRASLDIFGCNRCQLWVTSELVKVGYVAEWGHWSDA